LGEPKHGDLLVRVMRLLTARDFKVRESRRDAGGTYTYIMATPKENLPLALVAKGSEIMGEVVSVQTKLMDTWHAPILLAWLPPGEPFPDGLLFFVFNPAECLSNDNYFPPFRNHKEPGYVPMWNFSIYLGERWDLEEPLEPVWETVKSRANETLDAYT